MNSVAFAPSNVTPAVASPEQRARIDKTAKKFEAQFLSVMMGEMFKGVEPEAPFAGGQGESAFRSFMTDAMAKSMVQRGGIGLSATISKEMLKMQGLS